MMTLTYGYKTSKYLKVVFESVFGYYKDYDLSLPFNWVTQIDKNFHTHTTMYTTGHPGAVIGGKDYSYIIQALIPPGFVANDLIDWAMHAENPSKILLSIDDTNITDVLVIISSIVLPDGSTYTFSSKLGYSSTRP